MNQMQQMIVRAQQMQRQLNKAKEALAAKEFTVSKNGMVEVTVMGSFAVKDIKIDAEALDPDNADMVQDAIKMAINEALEKIQAESDEIEQKITGQMNFPF